MTNEDEIRGRLAANLAFIEPGLLLSGTEVPLDNPEGTGGRIDILARDEFGLAVVIEIKKSNKTARETVHELFKYVALLKATRALDDTSIRCIVVSTEWRELLTPFSEFVRSVRFGVVGYHLRLTATGDLESLGEVKPSTPAPISRFCPRHTIYFYTTASTRNAAARTVAESHEEAGLRDHVALHLDYSGGSPDVITPFALYIAPQVLDPAAREQVRLRELSSATQAELAECLDGNEFYLEEVALGDASERALATSDGFEIGHPDKLQYMLAQWVLAKMDRHGRLADTDAILPADSLVTTLVGLDGDSPTAFIRTATPRHAAHWSAMLERLEYSIRGNPVWEQLLPAYLRRVAATDPRASVGVCVFNPLNVLTCVYAYWKSGQASYMPRMTVIVDSASGVRSRLLVGKLTWDGHTSPPEPRDLLADEFGGSFEFATCVFMHEVWTHEAELTRRLGMSYDVYEVSLGDAQQQCTHQVVFRGEDVELRSSILPEDDGIVLFMERNESFMQALATEIEDNSQGMVEP